MNFKTKSVCVVDLGLFIEIAIKLTESFGQVHYWCPSIGDAFPKSNSRLVGYGIPGIKVIDYFFDPGYIDEVDLFVFPDVYMGDFQQMLEARGKRVFGSRRGDELELYRHGSKEVFKALGLPVGPYEVVRGIDALRKYLKSNPHQFVKISYTRGDFETFEAPDYKLVEPRIDELEHTLGAKKKITDFVVEADIKDAVELGYDGFCIDGKYPKRSFTGIEVKDKGYLLKMKDYSELPQEVTDFNKAISPLMAKYQYRNFYSTEIRITKDRTPYMIDFCARAGSPPTEAIIESYTNLAEIFWHGAKGKIVEPESTHEYAAEIMLQSAWADKNWQAISFPPKMRNNIKLRNLAIIGNEYYVVPQSTGCPEIGAVVALGHTQEEAIEECKRLADQVKGYYIQQFPESLDTAVEEIGKLASIGIKF